MTEIAAGAAVAAVVALDDQPTKAERDEANRKLARIATIPMSYSAPNPAFAFGYMTHQQAVPQGKIWEVTRYGVVAAPDPTAVLAGVSMWAFISALQPQDSNNAPGAINDVTAVAGGVPNESYPIAKSVLLRAMERLIIGIKGLANSQQLVGSIAIIEHDAKTFLEGLK